ncbi:ribonuclease J [Pumilibacter muris]|uniref:ribonuclease J n=1 Tax=Pumilibacter muris TaxID=2941510 RepID=UPI0023B8DDA6|nr:ribonuclease J [Pumilibacter muris]
MQKVNSKEPALKVIFLGGVGEIGKNMTALEFGEDIIVVDCGSAFPNGDMPGVDLVIPDISYLSANRDRVRGIVLTHGHEDHIGGLPYILKELNVPVYGTRLTLALIESKFREHRMENINLISVKPQSVITLGKNFKVEFVRVSHSVAGSCALAITTPVGVVFHTGDFKVDYTPIDGNMIDLQRIAELGQRGVLLLLAESTNVERKGSSMSEATVGNSLNNIFAENSDRRIFIATFASNIHRLQQIIDLATKYKRKVAFSGRSMINVAECAAKIGELKYDKEAVIDIEKINKVEDKDLVIITTGSQGEPMSALTRMASDEFNKVRLGYNDTVVISASPIPGNERMVYNVINNLYRHGVRVIYERLAEVHVSGHACQDELQLIHSLIKPKFFIPVHGEYRHLKKHAELAMRMGMPSSDIILTDIGNCVQVTKRSIRFADNVPAGYLLVDGLGVGDVGSVVLRDRKHLSEDGLFVVVVGVNTVSGEVTAVEITSRGFAYQKEDDLFEEAKEIVRKVVAQTDVKEVAGDYNGLKNSIRKELKSFLFRKTHRNPMILSLILEN